MWRVPWGLEFSSCLFSALLCPLSPSWRSVDPLDPWDTQVALDPW